MAKPEPELNGSRELIDYLNGDGPFSKKLVLEISQLKRAYSHIYEGMQSMGRMAGQRHAELLGKFEGMRRKQEPTHETWEDDDEDTDVTMDKDVLRRKAKGQHAKAVRTKRWAALLAGPVAFVGALLWELLRSYGPTMPPRNRGHDVPAQMGPSSR